MVIEVWWLVGLKRFYRGIERRWKREFWRLNVHMSKRKLRLSEMYNWLKNRKVIKVKRHEVEVNG